MLALGVGGFVVVDRLTADAPTDEAAAGATGAQPCFGQADDDAAPATRKAASAARDRPQSLDIPVLGGP